MVDDNDKNTESNDNPKLDLSPFGQPFGPESPPNRESLSPQLTLSNQGKVFLKDYTPGEELVYSHPSQPLLDLEEKNTSTWEKVEQAVQDNGGARIRTGAWGNFDFWKSLKFPFKKTMKTVEEIQSMSTFAIVTFTSRQAAVAARHCLADGTGSGAWVPVKDIPVPPLADSAVCDFKSCGKPVTLTLNPNRQLFRNVAMKIMVSFVFLCWGLPLVPIFRLQITGLFSFAPALQSFLALNLSTLFTGMFFAICPTIFKILVNFGSKAVSLDEAEFITLQVRMLFSFIRNSVDNFTIFA